MKRIVIIGLVIVILGGGNVEANGGEISYDQDLFINNNYFSILDLAEENYYAPVTNLEDDGWLIIDNYRQIVLENSRYLLGYIKETEEWVQTTDEAVNFALAAGTEEQKKQTTYQLELESWSQQLEGLVWGAEILAAEEEAESFLATGKLLVGRELTQERWRGEITNQEGDLYFSGVKDGIYSNLNQVNTLQDINFSAWGYSFGCRGKKKLDSGWLLEAQGENIHSWIKWNNVYTRVMDYENYSLSDEQASIGNGYYGYQDYVTKLIPKYKVALTKEWIELGLDYRSQFYPYINYQLLTEPVELTTGLYREFVSLKFKYKGLQVAFQTKDLDLSASSGLAGTFGFEVKF